MGTTAKNKADAKKKPASKKKAVTKKKPASKKKAVTRKKPASKNKAVTKESATGKENKTARTSRRGPRELHTRAIFSDGEATWVLGDGYCYAMQEPDILFVEPGFKAVEDCWSSASGVTYLAGMNTPLVFFEAGAWHAVPIPLPDLDGKRVVFVGGVSGAAPIDDELFCLLDHHDPSRRRCVLCWRRAGNWSRFSLPSGRALAMDVGADGTVYLSLDATPASKGRSDPVLLRFRRGVLEPIEVPDRKRVTGIHCMVDREAGDDGELLLFLATRNKSDDWQQTDAWQKAGERWREISSPVPIRGSFSGEVVCCSWRGNIYVATQLGVLRFDAEERALTRRSTFKARTIWSTPDALYCFGAHEGRWAHEVSTGGDWEPLVIETPERHRSHLSLRGKKINHKQVRLRRPKPQETAPSGLEAGRSVTWSFNETLQAAIVEHPDRLDAYQVYADWLQSKGDPRGDLIALMHAALDRPELQSRAAEAATAFEEAFLGELTRFLQFSWRLGFVESLQLVHRVGEIDYGGLLARALEHPTLTLLRSFAYCFALPKKVRQQQCAEILDRLSSASKTLTAIDLSNSACFHFAADPSALAPLAKLTRLNLESTKLKRLDGLEALTAVEVIALDFNPIKSIKQLGALSRLRQASMRNLPITDLSPLAGLSHVEELQLYYTKVADLQPLSQLTSLKRLNVGGTNVTDLTPLAKLPRLEYLNVSRLAVDLGPVDGKRDLQIVGP